MSYTPPTDVRDALRRLHIDPDAPADEQDRQARRSGRALGRAIRRARRRHWIDRHYESLVVVCIALIVVGLAMVAVSR